MNTLDPQTDVGKIRYLIGDTDMTASALSDEAIQVFLDIAPFGSLFQAAAMACESLARQNINPDEKIGDYQISNRDVASNYLAMATRFRQVENDLPAFAVIEDNVSGFNELMIIRNWVLRTET